MNMNQNTIVDYEAMADGRATTDGRRRRAGSSLRLVVAILGVMLLFLVLALVLQSGATPPAAS